MTCKDPTYNSDTADQAQIENYKQMLRNITNENTDALVASNSLRFSSIDRLIQGSALLSAITDNSQSGGDTTIDMLGRGEAVKMIGVSAAFKLYSHCSLSLSLSLNMV
jgi:hypothetical protein